MVSALSSVDVETADSQSSSVGDGVMGCVCDVVSYLLSNKFITKTKTRPHAARRDSGGGGQQRQHESRSGVKDRGRRGLDSRGSVVARTGPRLGVIPQSRRAAGCAHSDDLGSRRGASINCRHGNDTLYLFEAVSDFECLGAVDDHAWGPEVDNSWQGDGWRQFPVAHFMLTSTLVDCCATSNFLIDFLFSVNKEV
ncbi:hypothetical protein THAOC_03842, partial [Thalassiosira oceanica]